MPIPCSRNISICSRRWLQLSTLELPVANTWCQNSAIFLFERTLGGNHPIEPVGLAGSRGTAWDLGDGVIPVERILVHRGLVFGVEERFDSFLVPDLAAALDLIPCSAKTGATHEVRHQRNVFPAGHVCPPSLCVSVQSFLLDIRDRTP